MSDHTNVVVYDWRAANRATDRGRDDIDVAMTATGLGHEIGDWLERLP